MGLLEIVLIIIGLVVFVLGFLLPGDKINSLPGAVQIDEEDIRDVVEKELDNAKSQITDIVDETITYAMEKTERTMDRITNEKMLAVNEYSDTVLGEINKNHKEVVFLYDMLNDKHDSLKATVSEAIKADSEIKQVSRDAEITAKEVLERVKEVQESVNEAMSSTKLLRDTIEGAENTSERQRSVENFGAKKVENSSGFTPITAREVEIVIPNSEVSVIGKESDEKPKNAGRKPKTAQKASQGNDDLSEVTMSSEENNSSSGILQRPSNGVANDEGKNNNDRILQLHKAGKSNMAIARELGLGIGEVKLVIDLFEGA